VSVRVAVVTRTALRVTVGVGLAGAACTDLGGWALELPALGNGVDEVGLVPAGSGLAAPFALYGGQW
jgi:hypothetical protein